MTRDRVCLVVLDGVGIGPAPDSAAFGDEGANTLGHILEKTRDLEIPNLFSLGLGKLLNGDFPAETNPIGAYGKMVERSAGKDTMIGHWEIAGVISETPLALFPDGFPDDLMRLFEQKIGRRCLGNIATSGTEIIQELGLVSQATGMPIVYTSADSVFQVAAHIGVIPIDELYRICRVARDILCGPWSVGRVIARPFSGSPGGYTRTDQRKDFSLPPPDRTVLDLVSASGLEVIGIGKIEDIFSGRGITRSIHTHDNGEGMKVLLEELRRESSGLIFANLVDFDMHYGHRRDVAGFAAALEEFDRALPAIIASLSISDSLIITADHGNDPTYRGTDHTRELVPLFALGRGFSSGCDLGIRTTFGDIGATIAELLSVPATRDGRSFLACRPSIPNNPV